MTRHDSTWKRVLVSTGFGVSLTFCLLVLMHTLIRSDDVAPDERRPNTGLAFLPDIEERAPATRPPKADVPPPPDTPPPTPRPHPVTEGGTGGVEHFAPPTVPGPTGPTQLGRLDGDALPVLKVSPDYPVRARERGIEGFVLLEFTIDELGRVVDPVVIDAQPRGTFDQAALRAVTRFKYKPRVVNGEALPVSGVRHLLTFQLTQG